MSLKLYSRLPCCTCVERLTSALKPHYLDTPPYQLTRIIGRVHAPHFTASKRRRFMHNMFEPVFFGHVASAAERTVITGCFRMHRFVQLVLLFSAVPGVYEAIRTWSLVPVSTLPILYGMVLIIHLASSTNKRVIRDSLLELLEAEERPLS